MKSQMIVQESKLYYFDANPFPSTLNDKYSEEDVSSFILFSYHFPFHMIL